MNNELLNAVKQIVEKEGEDILANARRVSGFLSDLAGDVPKPQKNAFVKCLEYNAVDALKNAAQADRAAVKQKLAQRINEEEGLDLKLCNDSLALLITLLFGVDEEALEAEIRAQMEAEAKQKAEAEAVAKSMVEAAAKAQAAARAKAEAEIRAKIEAEARAKVEAEAAMRAKVEAEMRAKIEAEARAKVEAEMRAAAKAAAEAEARAKAGDASKPTQGYASGSRPASQQERYKQAMDLYKKQQRYAEAYPIFQALANEGYTKARYWLGDFIYFGYVVATDEDKGRSIWKQVFTTLKASDPKDADEQYIIGYAYDTCHGAWMGSQGANQAEAAKWFHKAAAQGHAEAQSQLGDYYRYGSGVPKDYATAVEWFRKAAAQGDFGAHYMLGTCYQEGTGVPQSYAQAAEWFRKGVALGGWDGSCKNALDKLKKEGKI